MADASQVPEPITTRTVGWPTIATFVVVSMGVLVLVLSFRNTSPLSDLLAGSSWRENAFATGSRLLIAVGGVIFVLGRLRPRDVGLRADGLLEGIVVTAAVWLLMQLLAVAPALFGHSVSIDPSWSRDGVGSTLRWAAVMLFGTALYEEIAYRGFLFPQMYLGLPGSHRARFWAALLLSQLIFGTSHIPAHMMLRGLSGANLAIIVAIQFVVGVLLLLLYLRTRNLWISIGIHGIANAPTPLVAGAWGWENILIVLIVAWPWIARRPRHRRLARVEAAAHPSGEPFVMANAPVAQNRST